MAPIKLPANQPPDRFYKGGKQIADFRSSQSYKEHTPEDWVASTTCCYGQNVLGLSKLPDGSLLVDEIKKNPIKWLGPDHVNKFGADTKILVKLLDAGQRLPIHAHPHVSWAKAHVGAAHGKAEAWYTLNSGEVYLGLKKTIPAAELLALVEKQDIETLLGQMHRIRVEARQTIYVPPGLLHAIGEGIMVVEIQEPEDLSILLEWRDFNLDGTKDGHLGLGFETALTGVENTSRSARQIHALVTPAHALGSVVAPSSEEYFRLEHVKVTSEGVYERGFAVAVGLDGAVEIETALGGTTTLQRGETAVIAHEDGDLTVRGDGNIVFARPPSSESS